MNLTIDLVGLTQENPASNRLAEMLTSSRALLRRSFPLICKRLCLIGYILPKTLAKHVSIAMSLMRHLIHQRLSEVNEIIFSSKNSTLESSEVFAHEPKERSIDQARTTLGMNSPVPNCQIMALTDTRIAHFTYKK